MSAWSKNVNYPIPANNEISFGQIIAHLREHDKIKGPARSFPRELHYLKLNLQELAFETLHFVQVFDTYFKFPVKFIPPLHSSAIWILISSASRGAKAYEAYAKDFDEARILI